MYITAPAHANATCPWCLWNLSLCHPTLKVTYTCQQVTYVLLHRWVITPIIIMSSSRARAVVCRCIQWSFIIMSCMSLTETELKLQIYYHVPV